MTDSYRPEAGFDFNTTLDPPQWQKQKQSKAKQSKAKQSKAKQSKAKQMIALTPLK